MTQNCMIIIFNLNVFFKGRSGQVWVFFEKTNKCNLHLHFTTPKIIGTTARHLRPATNIGKSWHQNNKRQQRKWVTPQRRGTRVVVAAALMVSITRISDIVLLHLSVWINRHIRYWLILFLYFSPPAPAWCGCIQQWSYID